MFARKNFHALLVVFIFASTLAEAQKRSRWEWEGVERIVAVGDVHGRYDQLVSILKGTALVDGDLKWVGGKSHFVLCGDLIDRGPDDRAVLDLVRRLQKEAASAGGLVHALLGNHEMMNLSRDLRYVTDGGYAAFAKDERGRDRSDAWKGYRALYSDQGMDADRLQAAFDEDYPPGYFARVRAFGRRGDYGRWLLDQPAVVKVNGIVFLHGGLTPEVAELGLDRVNQLVQESISSIAKSTEVLEEIVKGPASFPELVAAATHISELATTGQRVDRKFASAARNFTAAIEALPFQPDGPLWYRGISLANERVERDRVDAVLRSLNARAMMVGHTVTQTGRVNTRFDGRVYRGDVGMGYGRPGFALVIRGDDATMFDPANGSSSTLVAEAPTGEGWARGYEHLPDHVLEAFLREAEVTERQVVERDGQRAEICEMEGDGMKLRAIFKDVDRYQHELAAYWIDRRLDLGFVPVVVEKTVDGKPGALRAVIETAIDAVSLRSYQGLDDAEPAELIRSISERYGVPIDELEDQVIRARVFDALIGNLNRRDNDKLFIPGEGRVALVDHVRCFTPTTEIHPFLLENCTPMPADLENELRSLDQEELQTNVGGYLTPAQIDSVLARRDRIVEACRSGSRE